ncbi:MAG TPA: glycoside hydrolase domain-containing protein, partial [Acidobacteriaceae bacterium]|nr:glycoside hydrolase domain-containing protein [Acidobacteriaceae bacterium]
SPLVDEARVQLAGGRELVIEARRRSPDDVYVHAVTLNGKPLNRLWVRHTEVAAGAHLVFTMGPEPNATFGREPSSLPV